MKKICALLLFTWFAIFHKEISFAQQQAGVTLKGRVTDENNHPLEFVTISLVQAGEQQPVKGTITDQQGKFQLQYNIPGNYQLVLTYLGYHTYQSASFSLSEKDFGTLTLKASEKQLQEVKVFGQKNLVSAEGGNVHVNIENSVNAQGGTAYDVLRTAPGITISRENEISLNGKTGARLMLDGKLIYLEAEDLVALLKSLPSSSISSVDLLANPSVQFDAAGTAGLINIRTKRSTGTGFNGSATLGLAHWESLKQSTDLTLNYRKGPWNVYSSYNHYLGNYAYDYTYYRVQNDTIYDSPTDDTDKRKRVNGTVGVDYRLDDKQTIGLVTSSNLLFGPGITYTHTRIMPVSTRDLTRTLEASNDYYHQHKNRYNTSLNYRNEDTTGRAFTASADYGYFSSGSRNYQPNTYYSPNGAIISDNLYRSSFGAAIHLYAFKADYQDSLGTGLFSAGAKYSSVDSDNEYRFYTVHETGEVLNQQQSNDFRYKERIAAAYANYSFPLSAKLGAQAGLRLENTNTDGQLSYQENTQTKGQTVKNDYLSLFPALSISYRHNEKHSFSVGYNRRIDRPAYQSLNPFRTLLDELSFWQGNAFLQPQFANRFSLDYSHSSGTVLSFAYTHTSDIIAQITDTLDFNKVVMMPRNVGQQDHWSLNVTRTFSVKPWWEISASGLLYYVDNQVVFGPERYFRLTATAFNLNLQQTFRLPLDITAELSGNYNSATAMSANERSRDFGQVDIGFRKKLNEASSVSLAMTDVFLTNRWNTRSSFNGFFYHSFGHGESRQVRVNFTYNFGNKQVKGPRERNSALDTENNRIQ